MSTHLHRYIKRARKWDIKLKNTNLLSPSRILFAEGEHSTVTYQTIEWDGTKSNYLHALNRDPRVQDSIVT